MSTAQRIDRTLARHAGHRGEDQPSPHRLRQSVEADADAWISVATVAIVAIHDEVRLDLFPLREVHDRDGDAHERARRYHPDLTPDASGSGWQIERERSRKTTQEKLARSRGDEIESTDGLYACGADTCDGDGCGGVVVNRFSRLARLLSPDLLWSTDLMRRDEWCPHCLDKMLDSCKGGACLNVHVEQAAMERERGGGEFIVGGGE